jgi:hypothetical protein
MHTGSNYSELLLDLSYKGADVLWWPSPEHKAVTGVNIARLEGGILQSLQYCVYNEALKIWGNQVGLLLSITCGAMRCVTGLNFGLYSRQSINR